MAKRLAKGSGLVSPKDANALTYSDKFLAIRERFSLSQDQLAEKIGASGSTLGLIERGKTVAPSAEVLSALANTLGINPQWLLTSKGEMLLADAQAQKSPSYTATGELLSPDGTSNVRPSDVEAIDIKVLPYLPVSARAGIVEHYADDSTPYPWENRESLAVLNVPNTAEYKYALVVDVQGDSMERTLMDGSKVVITPVQKGNWEYLNSGVYCVIYASNFVIKRIKDNTLMESGILRLYSDNPNAGSFAIKGEDIRAIWRVRFAAYTPIY